MTEPSVPFLNMIRNPCRFNEVDWGRFPLLIARFSVLAKINVSGVSLPTLRLFLVLNADVEYDPIRKDVTD